MSQKPTVKDLEEQTVSFFSMHWNGAVLGYGPPTWSSQRWQFRGEIPNHDRPGCYALLNEDKVLYVGVGAGNGPVAYRGAGLGSRLHVYWTKASQVADPVAGMRLYQRSDKANGVTSLLTIGFRHKHWYLAYALEMFLIEQLQPEKNETGKR